jgi:hypothetical protein
MNRLISRPHHRLTQREVHQLKVFSELLEILVRKD